MSYGNGAFKPIPGGNVWSSTVPNGQYGVVTPRFGSLGNANSTPQISGVTVTKGNGYVRYTNTETGHFTVVSDNGKVDTGISTPF